MIVPRTKWFVREFQRRTQTNMRKLMTLMLGLSLVMGAVSVSFAQNDPPKKEGKKKGKKKKADDEKK